MGIFSKSKNKSPTNTATATTYQLVTDRGNGFYSWNGQIFQSDIVKSCIRPYAKAIGKLNAKHIRDNSLEGFKVNPDNYIRFLLEEPNPFMSGQQLQEKMATQLALNKNAFALIVRDNNGYAMEIYPIAAVSVEAIYDKNGILYLKFGLRNGKMHTFPYSDIIHLREDYNENDLFGDNPAQSLASLMDIIVTTDQGIVKAIKNSNVIKWLLKFNQILKPEDIKKHTKDFVDSFLNIDTADTAGAAAADGKFDAQQVEPKDYVPNALQIEKTTQRLYSFFNTNENIIQSKFDENQWNAYYESIIEPVAIQLSNEYTRKIFSRRERGFGNKIVFESSSLQYASMQTKLNLVQFVDRGMMTPNEVREIMNLAPIEGGNKVIRRLDTAVVE